MTKKRAGGLLLHITSLPSKYGVGDLGPEAYNFADFLFKSRQSYWQVLPLNYSSLKYGSFSPYNCLSAFAGNVLLISPQLLYQRGLLTKKDIEDCPRLNQSRIDFRKVASYKFKLLTAACLAKRKPSVQEEFEKFCSENTGWLDDFSLFMALRKHFWPKIWSDWPFELKERREKPLIKAKLKLNKAVIREKFLQYIFLSQWSALKQYCNGLGINIIGDMPIYVAYDSVDVWSNPEIFKLNKRKNPEFIAGVPPDLFSRTGQLWGNPVYNWPALKKTDFSWWIERLRHNLMMFDRVRIDHFRGFFHYWSVPAGHKTAREGKWMKGPGADFFDLVFKKFPKKGIIAEDLGTITPDIKRFVKNSGLYGMRVLQFGFGGNPKTNSHYPANHIENSIVYTGTHDNNTILGWFEKDAAAKQKRRLLNLLGEKPKAGGRHWQLIRLALSSVSNLAIIPVQDILGLGSQARMNHPAKTKGNWLWRLEPGQLTPQIAKKLAELTKITGRR